MTSVEGIYIPTDCAFIDRLLHEGRGPMAPGVVGVLGPQGGGKTTLGIQLVVQQALQGNTAVLVLGETPYAEPSIKRSILSCATGISTEVLETVNDDLKAAAKLAREAYARVQERAHALVEHLKCIDLAGTNTGMDAVGKALSERHSVGTRPTLVYIDGAGAIAERMLSTRSRGGPMSTKQALQALAQKASELAIQYSTLIFISHQMAADAVERGPFHDNNARCAADCPTFTGACKYVMVLNPPDVATGVQRFSIPVAPDHHQPLTALIRHTGANASFDEAEGWTFLGNRFVKTRHG